MTSISGGKSRRKSLVLALLCGMLAAQLWGCGTAAEPEPGLTAPATVTAVQPNPETSTATPPPATIAGPAGQTDQQDQSVATPGPTATAEQSPADLPTVATGNAVGQRVPDFGIELTGGETVTAEQLLAEGQPTFLFFFATW